MTQYVVKTADVTLKAQHVQSDPSSINNRTRGETATFDLLIEDLETLSVANGDTYTVESGQTEVYGSVDVDGTLTINGTLVVRGTFDNDGTVDNNGTLRVLGSVNRFRDLLAYDRHAGSYTFTATLNNTQKFKQRLPTSPNISSLVIGLEPSNDLETRNVAGKWGLIRNVTDSRTRALTNPVITLEIDILADYSEYSDITSVQNDLEI